MKFSVLLGGASLLATTAVLAQVQARPDEPASPPAQLEESAGQAEQIPVDPPKPKPMTTSRTYVNAAGNTVTVEYIRNPDTGIISRKELVKTKDGKTVEHGSTTVKEGSTWNTTGYAIGSDGRKTTSQSTSTRDAGVRTTKETISLPNGQTLTRDVVAKKEDSKVVRQVSGSSTSGKTWSNTISSEKQGDSVTRTAEGSSSDGHAWDKTVTRPAAVHQINRPAATRPAAPALARASAQAAPRKALPGKN